MAYEHILTERKGDVLVVTLNRPDRLNAAPPAMFGEIKQALESLDGARAVLIIGAGRAFCSGADVGGGALTRPEAFRLKSQLRGLVNLENRYRVSGGRLDLRERADLDRRFDNLSHRVMVQKHDRQHRW